MVKYFALALAVFGSLAAVDVAEARGRRGCSSCSVGGGCPGGVCYAPMAPGKMAMADNAPPAVAAVPEPPPADAVAEAAPATARTYTTSARRGLFARRR